MTQDRLIWTLLLAMTVLLGFLSLLPGPADLSAGEVLKGLILPDESAASLIVREIRLPRALLGIIVGATLGLAGAALQGLLQNPLAEPGIVGVSASAGLGAVIALYFGISGGFALAVPLFAMAAALAATFVLFVAASRGASVLTLILLGVAINSMAMAFTSLALNLSPNPFALNDIVLWLLGSITNRGYSDIMLVLPFAVIGWVLMIAGGRGLQALTLGDETATSLGVNLGRLRGQVIIGASVSVGACVAICGAIGFVGLVVPHMVRPFVGHDPKRILVPSALLGAMLLTAADITVRLLPGGQELKLGVVTSLIGSPFFVYLIFRMRKALP